jgi:DedD protein
MMERTLKERIIGAVVLVIFMVLVVPVFLDGPPEDGEMISERVLLPGQAGQETKTVILNRERTEPIPLANKKDDTTRPSGDAEAKPVEDKPVPEPVIQKPPSRSEPAVVVAQQSDATKPAASTTGMWAVQMGSFSSKENAEKLGADLRKQGYAAFLSQVETSSGQLHRVRIGPLKDRKSADEMAARLLKVGHTGQVLPHP